MNPLFHSHLVNGPWGDPVLYIEFKYDRRAILFDLGEVRLLPSRKLLKGMIFRFGCGLRTGKVSGNAPSPWDT